MKTKAIVSRDNRIKESTSRKVFTVVNLVILIGWCVLCILPFLHLFAVSLSSQSAVVAGLVGFVPVDLTLNSYRYLISQSAFFVAFGYSLLRVVTGATLSMIVTLLAAYPLAFARDKMRGSKVYVVLILACMFFSGGMIPTFIMVTKLGLYDTLFALILPTAMSPFNLILVVNFFRNVPKEMLEAASIEGAGDYRLLFTMVVPVSAPIIATIALLCVVGQWNAWFDGYLYMSVERWPLQTYIYHQMEAMKSLQLNRGNMSAEEIEMLAKSNDMTLRAAQIFIAMIPVLCVYPFAQKYFVQGILLGSVKE